MTNALVVTTDPTLLVAFMAVLTKPEDRLFSLAQPLEAIRLALVTQINLIVFDARYEQPLVEMACRTLLRHDLAISILVILDQPAQTEAAALFDAGADDSIRFPDEQPQLPLRIMSLCRRIAWSLERASLANDQERAHRLNSEILVPPVSSRLSVGALDGNVLKRT